MIVTVNTDAGFSVHHKKGSYAFWIVSNRFKILKSGLFKYPVGNPMECEMKAIYNALWILKTEDLKSVSKIIINTDCIPAITAFSKQSVKENRWYKPLVKKYRKLAKTLPKIEFRHVKAHTTNKDARSYVNNWCDTQAREQLSKIL